MKQRFSFSRLLRNDKLMMLLSLIVAVVIWALVVYGPGNHEEREIAGVPVSITLNDYASETLKLQIVEGANATATVKVSGARSVIGRLTAQDIQVTADTGNVIKEGTFVLQLRAVSNGDYSIVNVVGDDGNSSTVSITCDVWREQNVPVEVNMPNLKVSNPDKYQFGTPLLVGEGITGNTVLVSGPKADINRIERVEAYIADELELSETTAVTAELIAYDAQKRPIETLSFVNSDHGKVDVTVPVMVYHRLELKPTLLHVPEGYKEKKDLVTVTPSFIEFWSVPSEVEDYVTSIDERLVVDFDKLDPNNLNREITLQTVDGVRLVNSTETIQLKVNLNNISTRTMMDIPLTDKNLVLVNCPEGFTAKLEQNRLPKVLICGPYYPIYRLKAEDIQIIVDMGGKATVGQQVVIARISFGEDTAWIKYSDAAGVDVQISVVEEERKKQNTKVDE